MSAVYFLYFILFIRIILTTSTHVLIPFTCLHGHRAILLAASTALLKSDRYFITFIIPESCPNIIESIEGDLNISDRSYQIIYCQSYPKTYIGKSFTIFDLFKKLSTNAYTTFPSVHYLLSTSNTDQLNRPSHSNFNLNEFNINHKLNIKYNDISALNLTSKIDLIISDMFDLFTPSLAQMFDVPVLLRAPISLSSLFADIITKSRLPPPIANFIEPLYPFPNYSYKLKNFVGTILQTLMFKYSAKYYYNPIAMQHGLPSVTSIITGTNADSILFHVLGAPFAVNTPSNTVKPFGFLINSFNSTILRCEYKEMYEWLNIDAYNNIPVILISMGSHVLVNKHFVKHISDAFIDTCISTKKCRILWAFRQIDEYKDELQEFKNKEYIHILPWIPQSDLLQNDKIKLFITHGGSNGVHEALFGRKPMIVLPFDGDQQWNAMRVKNNGCGEIVYFNYKQYNPNLKKDLIRNINKILFENNFVYQRNVDLLHNILIDMYGTTDDFVKFVDLITKYGTKHILYTDSIHPQLLNWYHNTNMDLYILLFSVCFVIFKILQCVTFATRTLC